MTDEPSAPSWGEDHRNHPLITETDWGLLTEEGYFEDRKRPSVSRNQQRRKLHARVRNALLDLSLLFNQLDATEIAKIFSSKPDGWLRQNEGAITDSLAFILYGMGIIHLMTADSAEYHGTSKRLFEDALYEAGKKYGEADVSTGPYLVEGVKLDIDGTRIPRPNLLRDLEEGRELHPSAVRMLLEMEEVDTAPVQEELRKMLLDDGTHDEDT